MFGDHLRAVLDAELVDDLLDGEGVFAVEDSGAIVAIDVDVVFAEAGVHTSNYVVVVFVDQHDGGAEDD